MNNKYIFRILGWFSALLLVILEKTTLWSAGLFILLIEVALNIQLFKKVIITKESLQLEQLKDEVYEKIMEDISEILVYLIIRKGDSIKSRPSEVIELRNTIVRLLKKSKGSTDFINEIDSVLIVDIHNAYIEDIERSIHALVRDKTVKKELSPIKLYDEITELHEKGEIEKIIPIIEKYLSSPDFEEKIQPLRKALKDYCLFFQQFQRTIEEFK